MDANLLNISYLRQSRLLLVLLYKSKGRKYYHKYKHFHSQNRV